jgi:hypothetical protein
VLPGVEEDEASDIAVISTRLPTYFASSSLLPSSVYVEPPVDDVDPVVPTVLLAELLLGLALLEAEVPSERVALVSMNCSPVVVLDAEAALALLDVLFCRQPTTIIDPLGAVLRELDWLVADEPWRSDWPVAGC